MSNKKNRKEYKREYRQKNKDKIRQYNKQYNLKNRDKVKKWKTRYYYENKKTIRKYRKKYYKNHKKESLIWYHNNKDRAKGYFLKYHYNLTMEDKQKMIQSQNNKCAICGNLFENSNNTCVDHIEIDGIIRVRGILCRSCNTMLGYAKDSILLLKSAINYLEKE